MWLSNAARVMGQRRAGEDESGMCKLESWGVAELAGWPGLKRLQPSEMWPCAFVLEASRNGQTRVWT